MASRDEILCSALELPPEERQKLVHELVVSMEGEPADDPASVASAWESEIARRAEEVLSGRANAVDGHEVVQQAITDMKAQLDRK